jgi:hypothetical protein
VIKTVRLSGLAQLPVTKGGRGRFKLEWSECKAAKKLVASVMHGAPLEPSKLLDPERARMELVMPAIGLLLTGVLAILSSIAGVGLIAVLKGPGSAMDQSWALVSSMVVGLVFAALFLIVGSVKMLRLRSYLWAVAVAFAATLPWSPAWALGLPMGIWSLIVLRRPEVMELFAKRRAGDAAFHPLPPRPKGRVAGRMLSLFRSMGGYFLPTKTYVGDAASPNSITETPASGQSA